MDNSSAFAEADERTVFVRGLEPEITKELLEELFTQVNSYAGPILLPNNFWVAKFQVGTIRQVSLKKQPNNVYAFVEFHHEESVLFAVEMLDGVALFGRRMSLAPRANTEQVSPTLPPTSYPTCSTL
jgi:RNA-binding protein 7